jgi:tetratricopeptide (TPR) repeat protein
MNYPGFTRIGCKGFTRTATACFLIFIIGISSYAQHYKGEPVKKDRLIKALRSRQLQTRDIVAIIKSNGVNFALTPETRKNLIAAGARPEVIEAADENLRLPSNGDNFSSKNGKSSADYDDMIDQAIYVFKDKNNPQDAVQFLKTAVEINPQKPSAYQMLGFINLYGLRDLPQAQKYMKEAISKGGSAVLRVYHDDDGNFVKRCTGSVYISSESIRYESDDNIHTFETSTVNVDKVKLDRETTKVWKNHPIFKLYLKIGEEKAKFRFAPINGNKTESRMAAQLFIEAKINMNYPGIRNN